MTSRFRNRTILAIGCAGVLLAIASTGTEWLIGQNAEMVGRLNMNFLDGRVSISDVSLPSPNGTAIHIGKVNMQSALALIGPAAAAENVTLQNVKFETSDTIYRIPKIEFVGSNLNQAQLAAFFDKKLTEPYTLWLHAISASSVTIPELVMERTTPAGKRTNVIRNIVAKDIAMGRADSITAAGGTIKDANEDGSFGPINIKGLDLVWIASLYEGRGSDERRIFTSFSCDALQYKTHKGGTFRFDRITSTDMRMQAGALNTPPSKADDKNPKFALPAAGNVTFSGITMEFPDSSTKGGMHKWAIKDIVVATDQIRNGVPTAIRIAINEWSAALAAGSQERGAKQLRELGYETVKASILLEGAWNEPANEFSVKAVSLDFAQIGSVTLSATLGNIKKEMFSGSGETIAAASQGITAKLLAVSFENKGLYERATDVLAKRDHSSPEEVRKRFEAVVAKTAPVVLGNSANAKMITKGINDFIAKPGKLEITAKSKSPGGVPLSDFKSVGGAPAPSVDKLNVTATAK